MKKSSGYCAVAKMTPAAIPQTHLTLTYEEALKLHMALQNELMKISQLDRRKKEGKYAAVMLMVLPTGTPNIMITRGSIEE